MNKFHHQFKLKEKGDSYRVYFLESEETGSIEARLDFFEGAIRVAFVRREVPLFPTYTVSPDGKCERTGRDKLSTAGFKTVIPTVTGDDDFGPGVKNDPKDPLCGIICETDFKTPYGTLRLEYLNFQISVFDSKGNLLFKDRDYCSYNFAHELGRGSTHYITREPDEKIYGLGDKAGNVNKNGMSFVIGANDAMGFDARSTDPLYKQLPFYICENSAGSYGIYYDTYSNGEMTFGKELNNYYESYKGARFNEENLVYYIIFGTVPEIVNRFSRMCGPMFFPPLWSLKYCGSTMTYTDAPDADAQLRGFIKNCEKYGFKPGGFYLSSGYTMIGDKRYVFHWDKSRIPSPTDLSVYFIEHGVEFLPNVKPAFLISHPLYDEIAANGWFLKYKDGSTAIFPFWGGFGSYLDFTNPGAYDFWHKCVKTNLVDLGYRNIWNDNNEYDVLDEDVYACGFGTPVKAADIRPLFSFLMTMASLEAQNKDVRPFAVSRCGIGGLNRIAATWTGDNNTSFEDFRYNHKMAMTMSLSGLYNFGQDIGGFAGHKPGRELLLRWIQYGLFTPRFTLHSWNGVGEDPTMPWMYEDLIPYVKELFDLRERLIPYLYNEMFRSVNTYDPIIFPVFLKHPDYDREADCFYFGNSILACPVFDEGATEVTVDLPETDTGWYCNDKLFTGTVTLPCPAEGLPVWFAKAGSIIPYAVDDGLEFRIYALKEGTIHFEFIDDDGKSPLNTTDLPLIKIDVKCDSYGIHVKSNVKTTGPSGKSIAFTLTDPLRRKLMAE
ncbi:MAG: hypothetical protein K6E32_08685 [Lachnospiraceae bacterium]|nr:hypothetical protein [Lachnospiraceae bacterium]